MKESLFDETVIIDYLKSHAELDAFYIFNVDGSKPGLIHYFDHDGESWSLMEDNNDLVNACLNYLSEHGTPIFEDVNSLKEFEERFKIQHSS